MIAVADVTRFALMRLSRQERLKELAVGFSPFARLASRFVAGESLEEAVAAVKTLNAQGCAASFDHLEEEVRTEEGTYREVKEYDRLLTRIAQTGADANVSIKLSQLGLRLSPELCVRNTRRVVELAARHDTFVRVDMEGSELTSKTLEVVERVAEELGPDRVGCVLQSGLKRTEQDLTRVLQKGLRVRLCKGAYLETPDIAYADKAEVDANFLRLMRRLLDSGGYHAIATHDERILDATLAYAARLGLQRNAFELQMLYGIRRDLQQRLAADGYRVRVYVPYGRSWYPYFMRRLAERPANLWFIAKNLVRP